MSPTPPVWIRTPADLALLAASLEAATAVGIDTEADSLHHYPGKLCLVQVASDRGAAHLVDPLALPDLAPLARVLADPSVVKIFHAADNDLAYLKRLYGFSVLPLFDTALAARFLGLTALGLDELLRTQLGVDPGRSRQKDDWSRRPLSPEQETYALNDVLHLIPLSARLREGLRAMGREGWFEEECAALAALAVPPKLPDPDAYLHLKGTKELDRRGLGVLRELYVERERLALEADRPPFMIVGHEALVTLAARCPADAAALRQIPGCTDKVVARQGTALLAAIARGLALPEAALPERARQPRPAVPASVRRRVEALRGWRTEAAGCFGLDPGFLLPQRLIDRLAAAPPADVGALTAVEGLRRWRATLMGEAVVRLLRSA
ncbi:MAG: HRDC domain-containing protein [Candidatus Rokubacteria bacterium]|nr:HRDC domain-containing protein [Candidatus Rokubacteria bacterium]